LAFFDPPTQPLNLIKILMQRETLHHRGGKIVFFYMFIFCGIGGLFSYFLIHLWKKIPTKKEIIKDIHKLDKD
jgi:hypothetical protein